MLRIYLLILLAFPLGCKKETEDGRTGASSDETSEAKVLIPAGSPISEADIEISRGDQEVAKEALQATLPEDVTASNLVGNATYLAVEPVKAATIVGTLSGLLPLVDQDGFPVPSDRLDSVFLAYNVVDENGGGVSGILVQSTGSLVITDSDGAALLQPTKFARFPLQGIEGTYMLGWARGSDAPAVKEVEQTSMVKPKRKTASTDNGEITGGATAGGESTGGESAGGESTGGENDGIAAGDDGGEPVVFEELLRPYIGKNDPVRMILSGDYDLNQISATIGETAGGPASELTIGLDTFVLVNAPAGGWPIGYDQELTITIIDGASQVTVPPATITVGNTVRFVTPIIVDGGIHYATIDAAIASASDNDLILVGRPNVTEDPVTATMPLGIIGGFDNGNFDVEVATRNIVALKPGLDWFATTASGHTVICNLHLQIPPVDSGSNTTIISDSPNGGVEVSGCVIEDLGVVDTGFFKGVAANTGWPHKDFQQYRDL